MDIQKLRIDRGWSQEQLSGMAGLSARTIQRIENGEAASAETLKSLAAVFEVPFSELQESPVSGTKRNVLTPAEKRVLADIRSLRMFYIHLFFYVMIIALLFLINIMTSREYIWAVWPMLGWGVGVFLHGVTVLKPLRGFGAEWERKEFEKRTRDLRK